MNRVFKKKVERERERERERDAISIKYTKDSLA
jgi:hypothetical protein